MPGQTYYLRVTAFASEDQTPTPASDSIVGSGTSDGVTIENGEEPPSDPPPEPPPDEEPPAEGAAAGSISVSVSPQSLSFAAGESTQSLELDVRASGAASVELTSIREDRVYPRWGDERGRSESLEVTIPGGMTETLSRIVTLDTLDRAKALGASTEGSFTVSYLLRGRDTQGNPVVGTALVAISVSGAPASTLNVQGVSVQLPESPYFRGEAVESAVTIEATGSGTVTGQVYVDDSLQWSRTPAFAIQINGTTSFDIPDSLPTDEPGFHSVRVELISADGYAGENSYQVSAAEPPFPPETLTLIPGVAELSEFAEGGTAQVRNVGAGGHDVEYTFSGDASLRLLSMDGQTVPRVTATELVITYPDGGPQGSEISSGTVATPEGTETLATVLGGFLKLTRLEFDAAQAPDRLTARATLNIPRLDTDLAALSGLSITQEGVTTAEYSWNRDEGAERSFSAFGLTFRLHDVSDGGGHKAVVLSQQPNEDRYAVSLSGSIAWSEKEGMDEETTELLTFTDLTFYTDGAVEGGIAMAEPYALVEDMLTITEAGLALENDALRFTLGGTVANLPSPLESLETSFTLAFDTEGNVEGGIIPIDELTTGERGTGGGDETEWSFESIATVDVTYLALDLVLTDGTLHRDHSRVLMGTDVYLDFLDGGSDGGDPANRIGFGVLDANGELTDGLELTFDGEVIWPSPEGQIEVLSGKSADLGPVGATLESLALEFGDSFAFLLSGSFSVDISEVSGSVGFQGLRFGLDGDISGPEEIAHTQLSVMDFVSVSVENIAWGEEAEISYTENQTTGQGTNRQPAVSDEDNPAVIQVDNYFEIGGAAINIGSGDSELFSGSFDQLLFFELSGEQVFILKNAEMEVSGCELYADIKYDRSVLRIAGGVTMQQIEARAVGKIGIVPDTAWDGTPEPRAGEPTFGLFVLVGGLRTPVAPSVFLNEIGGGVFINPTNEDLETVVTISGFQRPELTDATVDSMRPAGAGEPGGFAVMLMAGVYVAEESLVEGQAMITLSANSFELDAEVTALEGMLTGRSYFIVSWTPPFAEGNNVLEADIFEIFQIDGDLAFYAYGESAWAVMGSTRVSLCGKGTADGEFFIGPPGFMVDTTVKASVDIGFVSGYIQFDGMVWLYVVPEDDTWGAWAAIEVGGSLLKGLVSATAGIEGALIGQGTTNVLVYAVGYVEFKVCWVKVFEGSLWASIGSDGFDGGTGRNKRYDALIDEARNMADQMEQAKQELETALAEAELAMYQLSDVQRNEAGLALVERAGWRGTALAISFAAAEVESWEAWGGGLPEELEEIRQLIFGEEQEELAELRGELESLLEDINARLDELGELQNGVVNRLDEYEAILLEDLPSIRELASSGNPFGGMQQQTVTVGETTRTVTVGFELDQEKALEQKNELTVQREGFADYQDAFIEQAGLIDAKLQRLDEILFQTQESFSALMERYTALYERLVRYIDRFARFQNENAEAASDSLQEIAATEVPEEIAGVFPGETSVRTAPVIRALMQTTAAGLSDEQLTEWTDRRIALINLLIQAQGGEGDWQADVDVGAGESGDGNGGAGDDGEAGDEGAAGESLSLSPTRLFVESGLELWWRIPNSGWEQSIALTDERTEAALSAFDTDAEVVRESWIAATSLSDTVFDRKADLYALLYEIYDQLAVYGSGMIAVDDEGGASGIAGLAGAGLMFRTSAVSQVIAAESTPLPAGAQTPEAPTVGPLRPLRRAQLPLEQLPVVQLSDDGPRIAQGGDGDSTGARELAPLTIPLGEHSGGLPQSGVLDRSVQTGVSVGALQNWVLITRYFEGKRAEIEPYLQVPSVTALSGALSSYDSRTALFSGAFAGSHPVAVTEYACRIRVGLYDPWRSFGTATELWELLLPHRTPDRVHHFDVRVRGAGGLTIHRTSNFDVTFFDEETDAEPVTSGIDATDESPPVQPTVTLDSSVTANANELYAEWGSADHESGIQRYEYAVGTYSVPEGGEAVANADDGVPTDVVPWTDAGGRTAAIIKNLDLEHAHEYVVSVRATNGVGLESVATSQAILVDLTPPQGQEITQLVQEATDGYPNSLRFAFTYAEEQETELAAHYFGVGTGETTADLFPWTEASLDFGRIVNLPFTPNEPIYLLVRAVNVLGLESIVTRELTFDFADRTPPPAPGVVTDPSQSSTDGSRLAIGWNGVEDPESGIAGYAYGISSTPLEDAAGDEQNRDGGAGGTAGAEGVQLVPQPDILGWITVEPEREPYFIGKQVSGQIGGVQVMGFAPFAGELEIADGGLNAEFVAEETGLALSGTVYAVVRVTNGAGLSTVASSPPVVFDNTPPDAAALRAQPVQTELDVLEFSIDGGDEQSGISAYRYRIYRVTDAMVATPWIAASWQTLDAAPGETASRTIRVTDFPEPGLEYGMSYDVRAELRNGAGLAQTTGTRRIELREPEPKPKTEGQAQPPVRRTR
ncbi:MAG: hypothetical protein ACQETQ_08050 [Spirochaetota bacterium]